MKNALALRARVALVFIFSCINLAKAGNSVLSTGNWYKLSAYETGIHIITYNDLTALGIPVSTIDPRNISLYGNGPGELPLLNSDPRPEDLQEMAIEIKGEGDGIFNPGDTIYFYNHSQTTWKVIGSLYSSWRFKHYTNHYTDSTFFFLTVKTTAGKRISDQQSLPGYTDSTSSYTAHAVHESEQINFLHSGQEWFGEHFNLVSDPVRSFPVMLKNFTIGDSTIFDISFAGRDTNSTSCAITFTFDGLSYTQNIPPVGTTAQDNFANILYFTRYSYAPFPSDSLVLSFQSNNQTAEAWLNYIEVNSICNLIFDDSPLSFRDSRKTGPGRIVKYDLTANPGTRIWDVTAFNNVKNQLYTVNGSLLNFNAAADSLREYIAFDGSNFIRPTFIGSVANQNLHSITNQNMIIVTDESFINEATTLAQYHFTNDNLSTIVVTPQQIYNEYSSGAQDVVAIRDFFRQVYHSASSTADSLKYVLMFGSPSYDYKNILGLGGNFVPIHESPGSINQTQTYCTDDFYTLMDSSEGLFYSNEVADIAIGRIPVTNSQEAQIINKIMSYNSSSDFGIWRTQITVVADDQDYNLHFRQSDTLANRIEDSNCGLNLNKIYIDAFVQHHDSITNLDTYPDANLKIQEAFQQGSAVIQYIGHGDSQGWASERILEYGFLDTVDNISNLPVIHAGTVLFNLVDDPGQSSASKAALLNQSGGCIASIAAARLAYSSSNNNFMVRMNEKLFTRNSGKWPTLGDAFLNAKRAMYMDPYIRSTSLLGDPAIRILFPENDVIVTSLSPDTLSPGQQVQITGEVHDRFGSLMSTFNGPIDITFYNPKTLHMTLGNDTSVSGNPGVPAPFYQWDDTLYHSMVNVVNGEYSLSFIMPGGIDSGFGAGRIAFYTSNGIVDAMGCYQNIIYRNLTPGIAEYSDLQIKIFPNPATDQIKCVLNISNVKDWSYTLTAIDGRKLRSEKIVSGEFFIERKSVAPGVYFLRIADEGNRSVRVERVVFE